MQKGRRLLALALVAVVALFALGAATPAQAHHKKSAAALQKQINTLKKQVKALRTKTSRLNNAGTFYSGNFWAFNGFNFDCADEDLAKFYDLGDNLFYLDCESVEGVGLGAMNGPAASGARQHDESALAYARARI